MTLTSLAVTSPYPFHHGIDPLFSEDGQTYSQESSGFFLDGLKKIWQYCTTLFAYPVAYLHPSSNERSIRRLILRAGDAEKQWHYRTKEPCIKQIERPDVIFLIDAYQHQFCQRLGELAEKLLHLSNPPNRLFPSEILPLMHAFTAHPKSKDTPKALLSSTKVHPENSILSRMTHLGLKRLKEDAVNQHPFLFETHYVSHVDFFKKTEQAGKELRLAFRQIRPLFDSPLTLFFFRQPFIQKLEAFYTAWKTYENSHELLQEMAPVFANDNHFQAYNDEIKTLRYDHFFFASSFSTDAQKNHALSTLILYDKVTSFLTLEDPLCWKASKEDFVLNQDPASLERHKKAMERENCLVLQGQESIHKTLLIKFPESKTAALLP